MVEATQQKWKHCGLVFLGGGCEKRAQVVVPEKNTLSALSKIWGPLLYSKNGCNTRKACRGMLKGVCRTIIKQCLENRPGEAQV